MAVGYSNVSHFAKLFAREYGTNPSRFRASAHGSTAQSGAPLTAYPP